jgi:hypothetical protein
VIQELDTVRESVTEAAEYRIGTLSYTKHGLFMLFAYLLWGDFCFTLMEQVFPSVTPLTMGNLGARNILVGLVITTIPYILNAVVCPWVSFKSDRHRSKRGRRIPFLLFPTPFVALFLVLIGLSPDIGRFLARTILHSTHISQTAIVLGLIATLGVAYQYFNMFVNSVYYYLFNDVVPEKFLSRFMASFRLVGTLAGATFNYFIFRYAETQMKWIFIGCGVLYFVAFMVMGLRVKEGEYPPPPDYVDGKDSVLSGIKTYFAECFKHKFYWYFFAGTAAADLIACAYPFLLLMDRKSLGLTTAQMGQILASAQLVTAALIFPAGWLADRKHPLQIQLYATSVLVVVSPLSLIYLFRSFTPHQAFKMEFAIQMILIPAQAIYVVSNLPMYMRVLPSDRFGQFCSAQAMFRSIVGICCGMLAGGFLDLMNKVCRHFGRPTYYYYRFTPIWTISCWLVSLILLSRVYSMWKQYGGIENYVPPV